MKSQRQLQIGESIKRIISEIFLRDDILSIPGSYITIAEADTSPDAKKVNVFVNIFGNEEIHEKIVKKLNEAAPHFRYQMAKKISLRVVPEIAFFLDKTEKKAIELESVIEVESRQYNSSDGKMRSRQKMSGSRKKKDA